MTSPESGVEGECPHVQLSFVFGSSAVKPQTPHIPPEDAEPQEPEHYSAETLSLSRSELKHVPDSILKNSSLKYLCLEGNKISSVPDSIFISLPDLLWLDLRKNQIASLPAEIGSHRRLKTLLLEGNPITELPPELGNVISLKGLNLRDCPIRFPPQDILQQGLQAILQYLRSVMAQRPVSVRKTSPELPAVEKLQLSELTGSSMEEHDESVGEDELQRFRELKEKLILLDKAELGSGTQGDKNPKSRLLSVFKKKKTTTKVGIIPELPLFDAQLGRRPEERRQAAGKELKEKQAFLEQRRKNQEALQDWRTQAKLAQEKKIFELKQKKLQRQRKREEEDSKSALEDRSGTPQRFDTSNHECEEDRSAWELERWICAHVEKMKERCKNPRGTATEQMAAAEKDVEEMKILQTRLFERKRNLAQDLGNTFTIYTGDTWPSFVDK